MAEGAPAVVTLNDYRLILRVRRTLHGETSSLPWDPFRLPHHALGLGASGLRPDPVWDFVEVMVRDDGGPLFSPCPSSPPPFVIPHSVLFLQYRPSISDATLPDEVKVIVERALLNKPTGRSESHTLAPLAFPYGIRRSGGLSAPLPRPLAENGRLRLSVNFPWLLPSIGPYSFDVPLGIAYRYPPHLGAHSFWHICLSPKT